MPVKPATRDYHPARVERSASPLSNAKKAVPRIRLPKNETGLELEVGGKVVKLTNLGKL